MEFEEPYVVSVAIIGVMKYYDDFTVVSRDIFTMPHSHLLLFWPIPTIPAFVRLLPIQTSTSVDLDEYSVKSCTPEMSANSCS